MDIAHVLLQTQGLSAEQAAGVIAVTALAARAGARLIPDNKRGVLGFLRKVLRVVGVDVPNRVQSGVTEGDILKAALDTPAISRQVFSPKQ